MMNMMFSEKWYRPSAWMGVPLLAGLLLVLLAGCGGGRRVGIRGHDMSHFEFDKRLELQLDDIISNMPGGPELKDPVSIAITQSGNLAILDRQPPRIIVIDLDKQGVQTAAGAQDNQVRLGRPRFIRSGFGLTLNVTEESGRLVIYNSDLRYVSSIEPSYEATGFAGGNPTGLAVADFGDTYLADRANDIVYHFGPSGKFEETIGGPEAGAGRLNQPEGLAITDDGNLIVCDAGSARVVVFDQIGEYFTSLSDGRMEKPVAVAVAPNNRAVFVCDGGEPSRLLLYSLDGRFLLEWDGFETSADGFGRLTDVAISGSSLYLVDAGKSRILVYRMIPPKR